MTLTRETLKALRADIDNALAAVAEKHGVSFDLGRCTYQTNNATFKLGVATIGDDGAVNSPEADAFKANAQWCGLKSEDLGAEFVTRQGRYTISGAKPRSPKYPILGTEVGTGKCYKFGASTVVDGLAKARGEKAVG